MKTLTLSAVFLQGCVFALVGFGLVSCLGVGDGNPDFNCSQCSAAAGEQQCSGMPGCADNCLRPRNQNDTHEMQSAATCVSFQAWEQSCVTQLMRDEEGICGGKTMHGNASVQKLLALAKDRCCQKGQSELTEGCKDRIQAFCATSRQTVALFA